MLCECNSECYFEESMGSLMALRVIHPRCTVSSKPKLLLWNDRAKKKKNLLIRSPAHFLSVRLQMTAAMEVSTADHDDRTDTPPLQFFSSSLFFSQLIQLKSPSLSYQHFGTTFCITLGSLPLPRLISGLYYTVLEILFWRKLHKRRGGGLLIIHGARFRFVPRCLRNWKFSTVLLCRRAADRLFRLDVQFSNSYPSFEIWLITHRSFCKCNREAWKDEMYLERCAAFNY